MHNIHRRKICLRRNNCHYWRTIDA
jgi:hypothetical protein